MEVLTIKDLQKNPGKLAKSVQRSELALITKRSVPLGVVVPFDSDLLLYELKVDIVLRAYREGHLSLGQVAKFLQKSKEETMRFLSKMGIDVIDYDIGEDMANIEKIA